jgi:hypothetical protein
MHRRIGLLKELNFSWSRLPNFSTLSEYDGNGDDNNHLKQVMALTSEHTNSTFPKQENDGSTTKYSRTIGNKKYPPLTPDLPHNAYDCSSYLVGEVKLEDQSLGFSPLFNAKNFEF